MYLKFLSEENKWQQYLSVCLQKISPILGRFSQSDRFSSFVIPSKSKTTELASCLDKIIQWPTYKDTLGQNYA